MDKLVGGRAGERMAVHDIHFTKQEGGCVLTVTNVHYC